MTQSDWNFSLNWTLNPDALKAKNTQAQNTDPNKPNSLNAPNFSIPWNLNFSYTLYYLKQEEGIPDKYTNSTIQTLSVTGEVNLSSKWKISASSGYDFKNKELSYTSIDIYRDLHCWEMRLTLVPLGFRKMYSFQINVKSGMLKDLKWSKRDNYLDNL